MHLLKNLPNAGILQRGPNSYVVPAKWQENKDKYIGKSPTSLDYGIFNYFILDLDTKHATNPDDSDNLTNLLGLLEARGINIETFTVLTRSGGAHLYYNMLDYPFKSSTKFNMVSSDKYGNVDVRGYDTWVVGPNCKNDEWKKDPDKWNYTIIKDIPPIDFNCMALIDVLRTDDKVSEVAKNAEYYLAMKVIGEGERDGAIFQIFTQWYRDGLTADEIMAKYAKLPITNREDIDAIAEEKLAYIIKKEQLASPGQREDKLIMAKRNWYYLRVTDEIFDASTREAYSAATFGKGIDNSYTYTDKEGKIVCTTVTKLWMAYGGKKVAHTTGWQPSDKPLFSDANGQIVMVNTFLPLPFKAKAKAEAKATRFIEMHGMIVNNVFMHDKKTIQVYYNSIRHQIEYLMKPRTWSLTIISTKGTGKGTLWKSLCRMLPGNGGGGISPDVSLLNKEFNEFLFEKSTVLFDEIDTQRSGIFTGVRYGALKRYISENEHSRTAKGKSTEAFSRPTYFSVEIHANSAAGIPLEQNDRRHMLVHCTSKSLNELYGKEWLIEYYDLLEDNEMISGLMHHIISIPYCDEWDLTHPYTTKWHKDLCMATKSAMATDILDALNDENVYSKSDIHTPASIRAMLLHVSDRAEHLTSGMCKKAIDELVSDGAIKIVAARAEMQVKLDDYGAGVKLVRRRNTVKLFAVRNYDKYTTIKEARAAFFTHLPKTT